MRPVPALQALRIPSGWVVEFNDWREVDPGDEFSQDWLSEDLLQLKNAQLDLLIDVGWCGQDLDSAFRAALYRGDFQGQQVASFDSKSRLDVVATVELWLTSSTTR